jgi:hypothetical protein
MIVTFGKQYYLKHVWCSESTEIEFHRNGITAQFVPQHLINCELVGLLTMYDVVQQVSLTMEQVELYLVEIDNTPKVEKVDDLYL